VLSLSRGQFWWMEGAPKGAFFVLQGVDFGGNFAARWGDFVAQNGVCAEGI
jgi:hypothetical protein